MLVAWGPLNGLSMSRTKGLHIASGSRDEFPWQADTQGCAHVVLTKCALAWVRAKGSVCTHGPGMNDRWPELLMAVCVHTRTRHE